jgi:glycosyltransferase involved in cell wall biosynthesis
LIDSHLHRNDRKKEGETSPLRAIFVGRFTFDKGADILVRIARAFPQELSLTVIGDDGPYSSNVAACPNITRRKLSHAEIVACMAEQDVLLHPSRLSENQSMVILEAFSAGIPVLAMDRGGMRETVMNAGNLLPNDDPETWINAMRVILNDRSCLKEWSAGIPDALVSRNAFFVKEKWEELFTFLTSFAEA